MLVAVRAEADGYEVRSANSKLCHRKKDPAEGLYKEGAAAG
jgi:hypothetical protein